MSSKSGRARLVLNRGQRERLLSIANSRKAPVREVQRAKILLHYSEGMPIVEIEQSVHVSRPTIYKWVDRALAVGLEEGLRDKYHRPREPVITDEAKAWVVNLACKKPKEFGYAAEMWTRSSMAAHVRQHASVAGSPGDRYPCHPGYS